MDQYAGDAVQSRVRDFCPAELLRCGSVCPVWSWDASCVPVPGATVTIWPADSKSRSQLPEWALRRTQRTSIQRRHHAQLSSHPFLDLRAGPMESASELQH